VARVTNDESGVEDETPHFEERQRFRTTLVGQLCLLTWVFFVLVAVLLIVIPNPFVPHSLFPHWRSEIFIAVAGWAILGGIVLPVLYLASGTTTIVRTDGVFQRVSPGLITWLPRPGFEDVEISPNEIVACHVVNESGSVGDLSPASLPYITKSLIEGGFVTGVYLETTGDDPPFSGVAPQPPVSWNMRFRPLVRGLLISDRPEELADAIEHIRDG